MPSDLADELRALREQQERADAALEEREALRRQAYVYSPTLGDSPSPDIAPDPTSQLEKVITEGLDENDHWAPTASTVAKMLVKAAPVIGEFVRSEVL